MPSRPPASTVSGFTVLVCRAPHPRAAEDEGRFAGRIHGIRLQLVPFQARPTHRVVRDWPEIRPGRMGVRCGASDCRMISEYEIVGALPGAVREEGATGRAGMPEPEPAAVA